MILLEDYQDDKCMYLFVPETGTVESVLPSEGSVPEGLRVSGFGSLRTVGLLKNRREIFVAAYTDGERLLVCIGGMLFDFSDVNLHSVRSTIFPYIKSFTITRDSKMLLSMRYFYSDNEVWPDNGDIFSYIVRATNTPDDMQGFIEIWSAIKQGIDVESDEFIGELGRVKRMANH